MRRMSGRGWSVVLLVLVGLMWGCGVDDGNTQTTKKTRVAFVYVGPISDAGWTYAHNEGRLAVEALVDNVETHYLESVPEGDGTKTVLQGLVDEGYDIIFTTSFGYMDATEEIAAANPEVKFEHCSGYKSGDNFANYFGRIYQVRYLTGIVAGRMTTTNSIGYVAAFPIPEVIRGINAFTLGVRSVNPNATVHVRWSSSWYDPTVEGQLATDLLQTEGADIITMHQDSTAPLIAAREAGAHFIGYQSDMLSFGPNTVLTSATWDWGGYYVDRVKAVQDGTWSTQAHWGDISSGIVRLGQFGSSVPQDVQTEVNTAQTEISSGNLTVFAGPINQQDGTEWVAAGASLSDEDLLGMSVFVEGVVDTTPP